MCARFHEGEHINEVQETDLLQDNHCINENARRLRPAKATKHIDLIWSNNHTLKTIQSDSIVAGYWA